MNHPRPIDPLEPRTLFSGFNGPPPPPPPLPLSDLTAANGALLFANNDGVHGRELWRSDGTPQGTRLVKDINPAGSRPGSIPGDSTISPAYFPGPESLLTVGNVTYFAADDGVHGRELWRTDGTPAGTAMVKDVVPGPDGSNPSGFVNVAGRVFFVISNTSGLRKLWCTNGTAVGTSLVATLTPNSTTRPDVDGTLVAVGDTAYFIDPFGDGPNQFLWQTRGTRGSSEEIQTYAQVDLQSSTLHAAAGRLVVLDHARSAVWSATPNSPFLGLREVKQFDDAQLSPVGTLGGRVYFTALTPTGASAYTLALWSTDGTPDGTRIVWQRPNVAYDPSRAFHVAGNAIFTHLGTDTSPELWRIDPATGAAALIAHTHADSFHVMAGATWFLSGTHLYHTDGTPAGTQDLGAVAAAAPRNAVVANGRLFFVVPSADNKPRRAELYVFDPASRKTQTLVTTYPPTAALADGRLSIDGTSGDDQITVTSSAGTITVLWNDQTCTYPAAAAVRSIAVYGQGGNDAITLAGPVPPARLYGGDGNDTLTAGDAPALLRGGAGNDVLHGGAASDDLLGDDGYDLLDGGAGRDVFSGGPGVDTADYSHRAEPLVVYADGRARDGAPGERDNVLPDVENLTGGSGDDHLVANPAATSAQLRGNAGDDTLEGGAGNDSLSGDTGDDRLFGYAGADSLYGGDGADTLDGGKGDDLLYALDDAGAVDVLQGGAGNDAAYKNRRDRATAVEELLA